MITLPSEKTNLKPANFDVHMESEAFNHFFFFSTRSSQQIEQDLIKSASKVRSFIPFKEFRKMEAYKKSPIAAIEVTNHGIQIKENYEKKKQKRKWEQTEISTYDDMGLDSSVKRLKLDLKLLHIEHP
mmetsp:Transcript_42048/g.40317  ORF Transcript_42048/g.40317 Transcript_42048/m.40317 type:complete len:128 (+) Transcript_42048:130-513(+)